MSELSFVAHLPPEVQIVGVCAHRDCVYVATTRGVYRLQDGRLTPVLFEVTTLAPAPASPEKPTFDEWFVAKYGETFEQMCQIPWTPYERTLRELSERTREYVSEMVRR